MKYAIVRCPGHWVFCGILEYQDEKEVVLEKGVVIRRFGTTRGIGEIANGPLATTQCDPFPTRLRVSNGPGVWVMEAGEGWARVMP